jgi:hypothetical protein
MTKKKTKRDLNKKSVNKKEILKEENKKRKGKYKISKNNKKEESKMISLERFRNHNRSVKKSLRGFKKKKKK